MPRSPAPPPQSPAPVEPEPCSISKISCSAPPAQCSAGTQFCSRPSAASPARAELLLHFEKVLLRSPETFPQTPRPRHRCVNTACPQAWFPLQSPTFVRVPRVPESGQAGLRSDRAEPSAPADTPRGQKPREESRKQNPGVHHVGHRRPQSVENLRCRPKAPGGGRATPQLGAAQLSIGAGGSGRIVRRRGRRVAGLSGAERRGQIDHHQDAHRTALADRRIGVGAGARPPERSQAVELRHRNGVRPEEPTVVPPAGPRQPAPSWRCLRSRAARASATHRRADRTVRAGRSPRRASAQAFSGPAHPLRAGGEPAPPSPPPVSRRADHRTRRGGQSPMARSWSSRYS